jgi:hypothetical protein
VLRRETTLVPPLPLVRRPSIPPIIAETKDQAMPETAQSRNEPFTMMVSHAPLLDIEHLRIAAIDPGLFAAASDYAKRFFPRSSLARAA